MHLFKGTDCYSVIKVGQGGVTAINDFGPFLEWVLVYIKIIAEDGINST